MPAITLYDYQYDSAVRTTCGSILCGGVGSGKSRTALAVYYQNEGGLVNSINRNTGKIVVKNANDYVPMKSPKDLYIITTARKRDDLEWEQELGIFLLSTDPDHNYYKNKVVIDSWNNVAKYRKVKDACFIFDEQRVVGSGKWVKSFLEIAKSNWWILLSATPGDNWMDYVPVFLANGFFRNRKEFEDMHCIFRPYVKFRQVEKYYNIGRLIRLRDRILVNMDFDRKTHANHSDIIVNYDIQKYRDVMRTKWNPYEEKPIRNAAELCYTLRKVVNSDESRAVALLEIMEDHPKAIIFYNFDYELEILKGLYYGENVKLAEWNGHKHQPVPEGDAWVYLVQYNAGAEGWNCVKTDTIIFYSQNYSYKIMAQASGRIDRLNTPFRELYYYHLKSNAIIDLAISRALKNKKKFNETRFYNKH